MVSHFLDCVAVDKNRGKSISRYHEKSDPFLDRLFSLIHLIFATIARDEMNLLQLSLAVVYCLEDYLTSSQTLLICSRVSTEENDEAFFDSERLLASLTGE